MVAPSFQDFSRISDPFIKGAYYYVRVRNKKTAAERDVRWYSDSEYARAYGRKLLGDELEKGSDQLKHNYGFDKGPLLVFRKHKASDEEWLKKSHARYAVGIGWHITAADVLPKDAPAHLKYLLLTWKEFQKGDEKHSKTPVEIANILDKKARNNEWLNIT